MSTVGIVIPTFGEEFWQVKSKMLAAEARYDGYGADEILCVHGDSLASARNQGAREIGTDYIVFLDADDRLCYNYCGILRDNLEEGNILYQPQTQGMIDYQLSDEPPNFIPDRDMNVSNNLVIGTAITAKYGVEFDPVLPALEDWDFFLRMISLGAKVKQVPGMVYYVGQDRDDSRNAPSGAHDQAYQIIRRKGIQVSDYLWEYK